MLQASNPKTSYIPLTRIVGSCILSLVFRATTRVVEILPYAVVLGVLLMQKHQSIISFNKRASARRHTHSLWSSFSPLAVQVAMALKNFAAMWIIFCAVCPLIPGNECKLNPVNMEKYHHLHVAEGGTLDGVVALLYSERVRHMDFNAQ